MRGRGFGCIVDSMAHRFLLLAPLLAAIAWGARSAGPLGADAAVEGAVVEGAAVGSAAIESAADTLPRRLARTLAGTIGERAVAVDVRLEEDRISGWIRPVAAPAEAPFGGPWLTGSIEPDGAVAIEEHDEGMVARIEGRLATEGDRLVLRGERRPVEGGEPEPVRLEERGVALGGEARLVSRDVRVADSTKGIVFYAEAPRVSGAGGDPPADPGLRRLDDALAERVASDREWFLDSFALTDPDTVLERIVREMGPSWYEAAYDAWIAADSILSVETTVSTYGAGAAHPNHHTWTLVWDLEGGAEVGLPGLFRTGSGWLDTLSQRAVGILVEERLDMTDEGWIRAGAGPELDNFSAWSVVPGGIRIVFDPYQVAAYAAGPQVVVVPWDDLRSVLDPAGPVAAPREGRLPSGPSTGPR